MTSSRKNPSPESGNTGHKKAERQSTSSLPRLSIFNSHDSEQLRDLLESTFEISSKLKAANRKQYNSRDVASSLAPGFMVSEFRLIQRLGLGGQGEVWEAEQTTIGRRVALKMMLPERITPKTIRSFEKEARAAGKLTHPGIISIYGFGEDKDRYWISQELIAEGRTLGDVIESTNPSHSLPRGHYLLVARTIQAISRALAFAHKAGVNHRDIKPSNILITESGDPKISDFGLAQITSEAQLTNTSTALGTWLYMSPEQITKRPDQIDYRSDIFSLGVVMYEFLALSRPFEGDTAQQISNNILNRTAPDLLELRSKLPKDLAVICSKAMEKRPEDRFQTASELADELERFLDDKPIYSRTPTKLERTYRWARLNPAKAATAVSAILTITAVLLLSVKLTNINLQLDQTNDQLIARTKEAIRNEERANSNKENALRNAEEARSNANAEKDRTEEVFLLSLGQDCETLIREANDLWPTHASKALLIEEWIERARYLEAQGPTLVAKRDELRAVAIPRTTEERQQDREAHPKFAEYLKLKAELSLRKRIQGTREGKFRFIGRELYTDAYPRDPIKLARIAWPLVDPNRKETGKEDIGIALSLLAWERAAGNPAPSIRKTLAWAWIAVGEHAKALSLVTPNQENGSEYNPQITTNKLAAKLTAEIEKIETDLSKNSETAAIKGMEDRLASLANQVNQRETWTFRDQDLTAAQSKWWHSQRSILITKIQELTNPKVSLLSRETTEDGTGMGMQQRLNLCTVLQENLSLGSAHEVSWKASIQSIRQGTDCESLAPQQHLMPIARNSKTGLWEFWDMLTGKAPQIAKDGELLISPETAIIFILIPGSEFQMGSQAIAKSLANYDPHSLPGEAPVHSVRLTPYFISKYELTQAQWHRLTGTSPSQYLPGYTFPGYKHNLLHPVEQVNWDECKEVLSHLGITIPSEAQWEYAARGNTSTPWWTGPTPESVQGRPYANLADLSAYRAGARWKSLGSKPTFDDKYAVHAPVDSFLPNPFGLYNVHGNISEWCLDTFDQNYGQNAAYLNPVSNIPSAKHTYRGGSFSDAALKCRASFRYGEPARFAENTLGIRPVRLIE